ncbi:MAG: biotin/lipoyl-containing protein [Chloroflexota bacterium]
MTGPRRTRVTIEAVPLVIQPDEAEIASFEPARRGEHVSPLPMTAGDRADGIRRFEVVVDGWLFEAATEPAVRAELRERVARSAAVHHATARLTLRAQIPGRVVRLWVGVGEKVERGQRLLAIEAMKMENEIRAPQPGVVEDIRVEIGARVEREDELLSIG